MVLPVLPSVLLGIRDHGFGGRGDFQIEPFVGARALTTWSDEHAPASVI